MTTSGWVFMLVSLAFVWGLMGWCFTRVLRQPTGQQRHEGAGADPGGRC